MNSLACSLMRIGLDASGFRELAAEELTEGFDERGDRLHVDGTVCQCLCECVDVLEQEGRCACCGRPLRGEQPSASLYCAVCVSYVINP